ncbi:hypothetical protein AL524_25220 [Citrobacter amalonaticus]|nr:hypothetical protein AL524_25220 [Citrobacter amalonaticus]
MINHSQFCFRGIFWLCHKKLHLTQLSVQLLGCSPVFQRGFFMSGIVTSTADPPRDGVGHRPASRSERPSHAASPPRPSVRNL